MANEVGRLRSDIDSKDIFVVGLEIVDSSNIAIVVVRVVVVLLTVVLLTVALLIAVRVGVVDLLSEGVARHTVVEGSTVGECELPIAIDNLPIVDIWWNLLAIADIVSLDSTKATELRGALALILLRVLLTMLLVLVLILRRSRLLLLLLHLIRLLKGSLGGSVKWKPTRADKDWSLLGEGRDNSVGADGSL